MGNSLLSLTLMFWCVVQLICHSSAPPEVRTGLGLMMTGLLFAAVVSHVARPGGVASAPSQPSRHSPPFRIAPG